MSKRAAIALEKSIAHWERMAAKDPNKNEGPSVDDCALCQEFLVPSPKSACALCPVEIAGGDCCNATPFVEAYDAWLCAMKPPKPSNEVMDETPQLEWRKAARAEVDYLKSLRDTT